MVARRQVHLVLQRQVGRIPAGDRGAGRPGAAARDRAAEADALLHAVMVAGFQEAPLHGHEPEGLGARRRQRPGEGRRQRSVDGAGAHAESGVESRTRSGSPIRAVCKSLYHAIFVANVETGESKQITDALADAVWPAWDASGKYLWFLASTDFGLGSQWLDMTSYRSQRDVRSLLRDSEEGRADAAAAGERRGHRRAERRPWRTGRRPRVAAAAARAAPAKAVTIPRSSRTSRRARRSVRSTSQIDFDDIHRRIVSVPGVPARQYSQLRAGLAGNVSITSKRGAGGGGSTLHRYRLSDRRAAPFVNGVADYRHQRRRPQAAVSRRAAAVAAGAAAAAAARPAPVPDSSSSTPIARAPQANAGRLDAHAAHVSGAEGGVQADLQGRLAQPARLPLRPESARRQLDEDGRDVRPDAAARECIAPISTTCSTTWAPRSPSATPTCAAATCPRCRPPAAAGCSARTS